MRLLALLPLAACTAWHAWQVPAGAGSDTPHVLVVTGQRAFELQESKRSDASLEGTVVNEWKVPVPVGDATLDDLGPEDVATVLGWERVDASGQHARVARSDIISARAPDGTTYSERGLAFAAALGFGAVILISLATYQAGPGFGRPLRVRGKQRFTPVASSHEWIAPLDVAPVAEPVRGALAAVWTDAARAEHASVAAFAKLSLELVALGAPPELLARAHQAARSEVEHARLCFGLARAYSGRDIGPAALPEALSGDTLDLARVARESVVDGCLGEGLAAEMARLGALTARDPAVAQVLRVQAHDEAEHAELAWAIVEWCLARGGEPLRAELVAAVGDAKLPTCHDLPEYGLVAARVMKPYLEDLRAHTRSRLASRAAAAA